MAIPRNLANFAPKLDSSGNPTFTAPTVFSAGTASLPSITFTGDTNTGIFSPTADTIAFSEGGAESMRLDSSGNLGLGSTSPSTYGDSNGGRNFVLQATGAGRGVISFVSQQTDGANELLGRINFIDSDSTNTNYRGAQIDGLLGSDANSAYLRFNTANSGAGTERMRITQTGSVLINSTNTTPSGNNNIKLNAVGQMMFYGGTTTQSDTAKGVINFSAECNSGSNNEAWANYYPGIFMDVQVESGNDGFANSALMIRGQRGGATNPGPLLRMGNGNRGSSTFNQVFRVLVDNGAVANSTGVYGSLSDVRLKQDITDASSQWDDIKAVRIRKFRMKSDFELAEAINAANPGLNWTPPYYIGAIAQEIEQVSPGLIEHEGGEENLKVIKYSILYMKAIKALQEAMARIETLEADVAALKAQ